MERSNLRLFSNIYPWNGRGVRGDKEFVSKIWDDKALAVLIVADRLKEVELTDYQRTLYDCTIQCPELPNGERPWGWGGNGKKLCLCRRTQCVHYGECRGDNPDISEREITVWSGGYAEELAGFLETWHRNSVFTGENRDTGEVDVAGVFGRGDEYDPSLHDPERPFDPNIASEYPDDEKFE